MSRSSPISLTLVGKVYSKSPDGKERAKKMFQKALSSDPLCLDAVIALSDLYIQLRQYDRCIYLLHQTLLFRDHDLLHGRLALVYTCMDQYGEAMEAYHTALSMNPNCAAYVAGLEKLEHLMKELHGYGSDEGEDEYQGDMAGEEEDEGKYSNEEPQQQDGSEMKNNDSDQMRISNEGDAGDIPDSNQIIADRTFFDIQIEQSKYRALNRKTSK